MREHDGCWLYVLTCVDGSFYVGTTRGSVDARLNEHNAGISPRAYTFHRRPVTLAYAEHFPVITDAIASERQIKGWSRAKKLALIEGRWSDLPQLSQRRTPSEYPSRRAFGAPQDEG